jgi:hypothetical protein
MSTLQVRPSRDPQWKAAGGWEVFEGKGACRVYCGETGKAQALAYAIERAKTKRDIQILDSDWHVTETIPRTTVYRCKTCGEIVDKRSLDDVLFHQDHKPRPDIPYSGLERAN